MTEPLLKIADTPPTSVSSDTTVQAAVTLMIEARVGAVAVIDDGALAGTPSSSTFWRTGPAASTTGGHASTGAACAPKSLCASQTSRTQTSYVTEFPVPDERAR
jgi:hypothetical protein